MKDFLRPVGLVLFFIFTDFHRFQGPVEAMYQSVGNALEFISDQLVSIKFPGA